MCFLKAKNQLDPFNDFMLKNFHCVLLPAIGVALAGAVSGCNRSSDELPVKPAPPVNVQVIHAKRGEVTRSITLPGNVLAYQQATLYAKVAGYLKAINVDKGDHVQRGALLAEIEVPELAADSAKYKADVEVTEIDEKRESEAFKKAPDLVMPQTVDAAKAKYLMAKANLERTDILLGYGKVCAPFSGVITRRWVDPGAFIPAATSGSASQNAALVTLADFSKVRVQRANSRTGSALRHQQHPGPCNCGRTHWSLVRWPRHPLRRSSRRCEDDAR